jgi:hypothetical protein
MSKETEILQKGYQPEIIPNGYQPENNSDPKPEYGYQPTSEGDSPTSRPTPPKEE